MQWSYIYFPTFAMVNKRDKARKAAKKKVTAAAQKSDSIKIRLPAAVRRRPSPRHEQDTQSCTNSEGPNERDSITPLSHSVGFSLNVLDVVGSVKIDRTVTQVVQAERCVIDNNGLGNYTTE